MCDFKSKQEFSKEVVTPDDVIISGFHSGNVLPGTVDTEMPFLWPDSSVTFTSINAFPDSWARNTNKLCHISTASRLFGSDGRL